jgi:ElaB/YqjD/DUF883 family membrane-anchored ribosome-binding protein
MVLDTVRRRPMFGKQTSRRHDAERVAGQAWESLVSAVDSAGASARSAKRRAAGMVDDTSSRVSSTAKEARRRADSALDALAGRRPPRPWGWLIGAVVAGAAIGWLGTTLGRQARSRNSDLHVPSHLGEEEEPLVEASGTRLP